MYTLKEIKKILSIKEQDRNRDSWSDEESLDNADRKPFTPFELKLLTSIHKRFTKKQMEELVSGISTSYEREWYDFAKLFGLNLDTYESTMASKKYIKWALDNWTEDGDYASIRNPIKVPPKSYRITRDETESWIVYRGGDVDVVAFDKNSAENMGDEEFYDWGGTTEVIDYGDTEFIDGQTTSVYLNSVINESKNKKLKDLVFKKSPTKKHKKKINNNLDLFKEFPLDKFKNTPPPKNESQQTEKEIEYLKTIPTEKEMVKSADDIDGHFKKFLKTKDLDFPHLGINKLMDDVKSIILKLKYHYNRPRPSQVAKIKNMELGSEDLKSANTPSYPSGHATQGIFISRYLSDLYPKYKKDFTKLGDEIAFSRNMAKVHYPSDIEFGKKLGNELYDFIRPKIDELHKENLKEINLSRRLKNLIKSKKNNLGKLNESTQTNQPLNKGDEIIIVDLDKSREGFSTSRGERVKPKTFTPYRIFGITYRQRENWEGPETDTRIYKLEPLDITDEQRTQEMIVGGGRRRGLHMIPEDTWILQKRPF